MIKKLIPMPRIIVSSFIFICTLQLYYYPILKDETVVAWWQVKFLKDIGAFVGFVPVLLTAFTTRYLDQGLLLWFFAWAYALLWSVFVCWLLGVGFRLIRGKQHV